MKFKVATMKRRFGILFLFAVFFGSSEAKKFTPCQLKDLFEEKFPGAKQRNQIDDWICLARWESNYDSGAVGKLNWDGSEDHGLFQISDKFWCAHRRADRWDKGCAITCDKLLDDDLDDDIECVKTIYEEWEDLFDCGFCAWTAWKDKCQPGSSFMRDIRKELSKCDDGNKVKRRFTNSHFLPHA